MAHINLLPWREEKRQERQQQFYVAMGITLAFAIVVFLYHHQLYERAAGRANSA